MLNAAFATKRDQFRQNGITIVGQDSHAAFAAKQSNLLLRHRRRQGSQLRFHAHDRNSFVYLSLCQRVNPKSCARISYESISLIDKVLLDLSASKFAAFGAGKQRPVPSMLAVIGVSCRTARQVHIVLGVPMTGKFIDYSTVTNWNLVTMMRRHHCSAIVTSQKSIPLRVCETPRIRASALSDYWRFFE
jgi:hypothetical protein